ncbi:hypothetical protein [Vibrio neptunius]|uniref:hypothetical protein n=1 Tax=Vibrio neptunius TaxID=170651 RepID=UPI0019D08EDA|nr:hypothetical protein [Vibrio neptunius]MBN3575887.1 hypothetical protein [Vibrio neptunius]
MKLISSSTKLVAYFSGNNSLLDSKIKRIEVLYSDSGLCINIDISMRPSSDYDNIKLSFIGCKMYSFCFSDDYCFYNVESLKFFINDDGLFYISLDPYGEEQMMSDEDQDFILCKDVFAYELFD